MGNRTATSRERRPGPTKNGTWWSMPSALQTERVHPASHVLGDVEREGSRPLRVRDVVIVEVDGVELVRCKPEVLDAPLERGPGDTPDGRVHAAAVEAVG